VDPAVIVAALAGFLPAFLGRAAEELGDELGSDAGRMAKKLWDRLRDSIMGNPVAKDAAESVADRPGDPRATGALELQLESMLKRDDGLRRDLEAILAARPSGAITATDGGSVVIGGQQASNGGLNIGGSVGGNVTKRG
jgi:hypothetical protein